MESNKNRSTSHTPKKTSVNGLNFHFTTQHQNHLQLPPEDEGNGTHHNLRKKTDHSTSKHAQKPSVDNNEKDFVEVEIIIQKRFKVKLDSSFQKTRQGLFIGLDLSTFKEVAIKLVLSFFSSFAIFQFGSSKGKDHKTQKEFFIKEKEILHTLKEEEGFTKLIDSGHDDDQDLFYIVMNKLDEDLCSIIHKSQNGGSLQLQTTVNIGLQLLIRIETLHSFGLIHRDLKPKNIMIDYSNQEIHLIDFGLSSKYLNQHNVHIPFKNTNKILGTPFYASNNALFGKEISRRDDIESMVYILIYCLKGHFPWKGTLTIEFLKTEAAKQKILNWRDPEGELCQEIPKEFKELLIYAQRMDFEEDPDYEYIENMLQSIKEKHKLGDTFEWQKESDKIGNDQLLSRQNSQLELIHSVQNDSFQMDQGVKKKKKTRIVRKIVRYQQNSALKFNKCGVTPKNEGDNYLNFEMKAQQHITSTPKPEKRQLMMKNKKPVQVVKLSTIKQQLQSCKIDQSFKEQQQQMDNGQQDQSNTALKVDISQGRLGKSANFNLNNVVSKFSQIDQSQDIIQEVVVYKENVLNGDIKTEEFDQECFEEGITAVKEVPDFANKETILCQIDERMYSHPGLKPLPPLSMGIEYK